MTTALYLLRAKQMGFTIAELDEITTGMVFDCLVESSNDNATYDLLPSQEDFDNF